MLCKYRFGRSYSNLQPRITSTLLKTFLNKSLPFSSHYGALKGLSCFGPLVTKTLIIPYVPAYVAIVGNSNNYNVAVTLFFVHVDLLSHLCILFFLAHSSLTPMVLYLWFSFVYFVLEPILRHDENPIKRMEAAYVYHALLVSRFKCSFSLAICYLTLFVFAAPALSL